jgi:hypothetical protein
MNLISIQTIVLNSKSAERELQKNFCFSPPPNLILSRESWPAARLPFCFFLIFFSAAHLAYGPFSLSQPLSPPPITYFLLQQKVSAAS